MKAQASLESFLYFGLLLVLLGGLIIWILGFMKTKIAFSEALTLYLFQVKWASIFEKASQLDKNAYIRIHLPSELLGVNYKIILSYASSSHTVNAGLILDNYEYRFQVQSSIPFQGETTLKSGKQYILINKGDYVEVIKE